MPTKPASSHVQPRGAGTAGRSELLSGKLAPTLVAHPIRRRARLLSALTQSVERAPLTLISGPAGAGKTALAASWRNARPESRDIGWLTLDGFDDDPGTFWSYAVEALVRAGADLPGLGRPVPGQSLPWSFVPRLAAALMAAPRPVVLIVDNADHLVDRQITGAIDLLIRNAGARLRLVLCARSDPQLPLHSYRLAGILAEIRSADLACTPAETADLLSAAGVSTTPEVAARLCELTEGWAVGLRLAVAPLKRGMAPEELVAALVQDDGSVAQYLFEEVLRDQPAAVRRFLLRISVTDELWPDLVDRLGGRPNGRRILAGLAAANAFVEHSPGAPGGFRIHALFREMLRAQLAYGHPTEVARLHRVCAGWYDAAGSGPAAVHHAVAARDWSLATQLLVEDLLIGHALAHQSDPALPDMAALPADLVAPDAVVVRAATALSTGGLPTAADLAISTDAAADATNGLALRATAAVVSVAGAAFRGSADFPPGSSGTADELVASLPKEREAERRDMTAVLSTARFLRTLSSDRPTPALLADLGAAAVAANAAGSRPLRVWPVAYLAVLEALAGRLSRAERLARDAAAGWTDGPRAERSPCPAVAVAQAWVHLGRFELEAAREAADRASDQRAGSPDERFTAPLVAVVDSCLLRVRHEHAAADAVLQPYVTDAGLPRWIREEVVTEVARIALARGRVAEAMALLDATDDGTGWTARWRATAALLDHSAAVAVPRGETHGSRDGTPVVTVQSGVVRACQHLEAGTVPAAVGELSRALDVAARETLRWPFLDAPLQARRLLRTHPNLRGHAEWLSLSAPPDRYRRGAGPAAEQTRPAPLVQDLSEREREVLVHLAEMLSTTEIAATMFISVNTVRTHIRSILRKLSATRRNQAVRRARELGII
jgi:LuxR family maltose regulon positive regulatory protein